MEAVPVWWWRASQYISRSRLVVESKSVHKQVNEQVSMQASKHLYFWEEHTRAGTGVPPHHHYYHAHLLAAELGSTPRRDGSLGLSG